MHTTYAADDRLAGRLRLLSLPNPTSDALMGPRNRPRYEAMIREAHFLLLPYDLVDWAKSKNSVVGQLLRDLDVVRIRHQWHDHYSHNGQTIAHVRVGYLVFQLPDETEFRVCWTHDPADPCFSQVECRTTYPPRKMNAVKKTIGDIRALGFSIQGREFPGMDDAFFTSVPSVVTYDDAVRQLLGLPVTQEEVVDVEHGDADVA